MAAKQTSEPLFTLWIERSLQTEKMEDTLKLAKQATSLCHAAPGLWILRSKLMLKDSLLQGKEESSTSSLARPDSPLVVKRDIVDMLLTALAKKVEQPEIIWTHLLEYCIIARIEFEQILKYYKVSYALSIQYFQQSLLSLGKQAHSVKEAFLYRVLLTFGIQKARQVYER